MTLPIDDDLAAIERARARLAARIGANPGQLPAVVGPTDSRDAARREALRKLDEALALLRDDATTTPAPLLDPAPTSEAFRTVVKVKSSSPLSSMIPTLQPVEARDDLTLIRGIDERMSRRLAALGITRFRQIADWRPDDIHHVVHGLGLGHEIAQYDWIEQARHLAANGPKTTRLEPVMRQSRQPDVDRSTVSLDASVSPRVSGLGLDDILARIRATVLPAPPPPPPPEVPIEHVFSAPRPAASGSLSPLPVAPLTADGYMPQPTAAPIPIHVDADERLSRLESELHDLAATFSTTSNSDGWREGRPAATIPMGSSMPNQGHQVADPLTAPSTSATIEPASRALIVAPTLRDRLGGLDEPPISRGIANETQDNDDNVEEADVMIVTTGHASNADVRPGSVTQSQAPLKSALSTLSRALVPVNRGSPDPHLVARPLETTDADADRDEATVVIVRHPKAANTVPNFAFFNTVDQPPEERAVQRFLSALDGKSQHRS
jgi:predicted flap endonuclease-1-like 5' DNA nuclease